VSMLTVVIRRPALVDMPLNRGAGPGAGSAGGGPNATTGVSPAAHNPAKTSTKAPPVRRYANVAAIRVWRTVAKRSRPRVTTASQRGCRVGDPEVGEASNRCVLFAIFQGPESLSHFALLYQRERI